MRGEHFGAGEIDRYLDGSSPHARGTRLDGGEGGGAGRFIPACAGNTVSALTPMRISRGSSPHARGTHHPRTQRWRANRFIPACAGNTRASTAGGRWSPVHPRMRGEHDNVRDCTLPPFGSSPHARGTLLDPRLSVRGFRFIPACAGNTPDELLRHRRSAVHPRMRGEHTSARWKCASQPGSSPHARGTLVAQFREELRRRFIPACAGNTIGACLAKLPCPVHPRMRGEHGRHGVNPSQTGGSSPHARGTLYLAIPLCMLARFIPACAGNTCLSVVCFFVVSVHPRMRGEH